MVIGMVSIFYAFVTAPTLAGADLFYFFGFFLAFFSKRVDNSEKPAHPENDKLASFHFSSPLLFRLTPWTVRILLPETFSRQPKF
jgi:hypothetical protein